MYRGRGKKKNRYDCMIANEIKLPLWDCSSESEQSKQMFSSPCHINGFVIEIEGSGRLLYEYFLNFNVLYAEIG